MEYTIPSTLSDVYSLAEKRYDKNKTSNIFSALREFIEKQTNEGEPILC